MMLVGVRGRGGVRRTSVLFLARSIGSCSKLFLVIRDASLCVLRSTFFLALLSLNNHITPLTSWGATLTYIQHRTCICFISFRIFVPGGCVFGSWARRKVSSPSGSCSFDGSEKNLTHWLGGGGGGYCLLSRGDQSGLSVNTSTTTTRVYLVFAFLLLSPPPPRSRDVLRAAQGLRAAEAAPRGGGHDEGDEGERRSPRRGCPQRRGRCFRQVRHQPAALATTATTTTAREYVVYPHNPRRCFFFR